MTITVKIDGLRALDAALGELPKAVGKSVLRRTAIKALKPVAETAASLAPIDADPASSPKRPPGTLKRSYTVGTKLNKRQARAAKKDGKSSVEVYAGTNDPAGIQTEFGNAHQRAQPHLRPAWEAGKEGVLEIVKTELGGEIDKAAARLAKRRARG